MATTRAMRKAMKKSMNDILAERFQITAEIADEIADELSFMVIQEEQESSDMQSHPTKKHSGTLSNKPTSVSTMAQSGLPSGHFKVPPYCHWFGIAMHELLDVVKGKLKKREDKISMELLNVNFEISSKSLEKASSAIRCAANLSSVVGCYAPGVLGDTKLRSCELLYTGIYASILQSFLFEEENNIGLCIHQAPSRAKQSSEEAADVGIFPFTSVCGSYSPGLYVAQWDIKNKPGDFDVADRQSALYTVNNIQLARKAHDTWGVYMGMPGTKEKVELQIYFAVHDQLWRMVIVSGPPHDEAMLCTFYAGIHYLLKNPITYGIGLRVPWPILTVKPEPVHEDSPSQSRVYIANGKVCKLYDKNEELFQHNIKLLKNINFSHELTDLGTTGRFFILSRDYIEGGHKPEQLSSFAGVIKMLARVHELDYVHGDVRVENMIFTHQDSWLIDFDLARPQGSFYNSLYNGKLTCKRKEGGKEIEVMVRHSSAYASSKMTKEQDRHSIGVIIELFFKDHEELPTIKKQLMDLTTGLEAIADLLEKCVS